MEGTELVEDQVLGNACFTVARQVFGWQGQGTYVGKTSEGQEVVYRAELAEGQALNEGPLRFTVDTSGPYYHGPSGTHGMTDSTCAVATAGSPITGAVFSVFAEGHVFKLHGGLPAPCTGVGSWARLGADWHAQWALDADCTVVGNEVGTPGTGVAKAQTVHTHEGTHDPCGGSCLANFKLDYTQHPPVEGLAVNVAGPTSVALTRSATLTAVVAYDGAPLSGASVVFSVTGPTATSPPGATMTTGATGQAAFTFGAGLDGHYVVTATATSPAHPGEEKSTTHTVSFSGPRPVMSVSSMPRVQNGDPAVIVATILDESDPVANFTPKDPVGGVTVSFSVAGPAGGQATPASGTAVTDGNGRASFPFTADRAGEYTVTASASYAGIQMTAIRIVRFDVKTLSVVGIVDLPTGDLNAAAGVTDPSGDYAYLTFANRIVKLDLVTGEDVGLITISGSGSYSTALIDPTGTFAYFGTTGSSTRASRIVKVDLRTFTQAGVLILPAAEYGLETAVMDPAGSFAYFVSSASTPGSQFKNAVIKIDLSTFQRSDALVLETAAFDHQSVIDPAGRYAYITGRSTTGVANLNRIDLLTFGLAGSLNFAEGERDADAAVIDPAGDYAYFAVLRDSVPSGLVVKVDLRTLQRVGALPLLSVGIGGAFGDHLDPLGAATVDSTGEFGYFTGSAGGTQVVAKVDLRNLETMHLVPLGVEGARLPNVALMHPEGEYAYFGTESGSGFDRLGHWVTFDLRRAPNGALVTGSESYSTPYVTPLTVAVPGVLGNDVDTDDADMLTAGWASDPAGGSVSLGSDGSFSYAPDVGFSGVDTFTYQASDGIDVSAPTTVTVTVGAPPLGVQSVVGGACAYATNVGLFGGPPELKGCGQAEASPASSSQVASRSASVALPSTGSEAPVTAFKPQGAIAMYGPAALFSGIWPDDSGSPSPSGPLSASTEGTTGPGGSVSSSAHVVLHDTPLPVRCDGDPAGTTNCRAPGGIGPGPLIASEAHSTCSASEWGLTASATFVNGVVETKYDPATQLPTETVSIPSNPPPNFTLDGTLDHLGDRYRVVLNEQILGPDSITVNAAHMYLLGPTAVGELIVGQSRCGVELAAPNSAPLALDDAYTVTSGGPLNVAAGGVLANDTDSDGQSLRASAVAAVPPPTSGGGGWVFPSDPAHGTVTLRIDGSFTYTPDAGFVGSDSFTYQAQDGRGGSAVATVSLTIQAAPTAVDDAYSTTADNALTVASPGVLGNDTDADGDTLTAGSASTPANGTVTLNLNGGFVYTPNANFSGTDTFNYTVSDGNGGTDIGQVTITVTATNGSAFHPLTPTRILDTRPAPNNVGPYTTPWGPGTTRDVTVTGGAVPAGADAVTLNVTVTDTTGAGFLTIWPKGQAQPVASNLNWAPGQTIPNAVTVKVGASGQISINNPVGSTQVIIDIVGYYDGQPGDGYTPLDPARILDSRPAPNTVGPFPTPWGPNQTRQVTVTGVGGVPVNADAVVLNATVTGTTGNGFLTIWPNGQAQPTASSLNWAPGQTIPNAVTVKVGTGGMVSVFNAVGNANVIFDVVGYFAPGTGHLFHPVNPARVLDTRPPPNQVGPHSTPWPAGTSRDVQIGGHGGVPANAAAALLNVTVTRGTDHSFLSIWPAGQPAPLVSSLNWAPGDTIPNSVTTKLSAGGAITIRNHTGTVHVIADTNGWFG